MIHDNIYFHNVVEMELTEKGYQLRRLPKDIRLQANDGVQNNVFGTGIELRFKMPGGATWHTVRLSHTEVLVSFSHIRIRSGLHKV